MNPPVTLSKALWLASTAPASYRQPNSLNN